jgi:hypothetical protein
MIISHRYKFVMMAPWKCASTTFKNTIGHLNESPYSDFFAFNPILNRVVHQHLNLGDFLALPESRLGYQIATFVRNPYDRVYSAFLQVQRDVVHQPKIAFEPAWVRELVCTQLSENMNKIITAGYDFNLWVQSIREADVYEAGRNTNFVLHPAHYWTHVDGSKTANFIGRVENFEEDFLNWCKEINLPMPKVKLGNVTETVDSLDANHFRHVHHMSTASIERINTLFREDFNLFNYPMI